jgi:hypothetical protein
VEDSSEGKLLIQYFIFKEDQYLSGFYIIRSWNYLPEAGWLNYYPWSLDATYLGTRSTWLESFDVGEVIDVENEWET